MIQTQAAVKIRIVSGFLSALDKCPDCGDKHDVEQQVECRVCGYHAGGDLGEEWLNHCEEELKDIPDGVTLDFAHDVEGGSSDRYFDFTIDPEADQAKVLSFFQRIAGGPSEAVIIDREKYELTDKLLTLICAGVYQKYSSAPAEENRWHEANEAELLEAQREIGESEPTATTEWARSAREFDDNMVRSALNAIRAGKRVMVGQDDDGFYFAEVR